MARDCVTGAAARRRGDHQVLDSRNIRKGKSHRAPPSAPAPKSTAKMQRVGATTEGASPRIVDGGRAIGNGTGACWRHTIDAGAAHVSHGRNAPTTSDLRGSCVTPA